MIAAENQSGRRLWSRLLGLGSSSEAAWSVILAGICLGPLLAYSLPDAPFAVWPWSAALAEFAAGLVPAIDRLAQVSAMPEVTRLFMALQWLIWGPVCFVIFLIFGRPTEQSVLRAMRLAEARWWYFFLGPVAMAVLAWFVVTLPLGFDTGGSLDQIVHAMGRSRFWLGLCGSVLVMVAACSVAALLKSFRMMKLAYAVRASSPLYRKL